MLAAVHPFCFFKSPGKAFSCLHHALRKLYRFCFPREIRDEGIICQVKATPAEKLKI